MSKKGKGICIGVTKVFLFVEVSKYSFERIIADLIWCPVVFGEKNDKTGLQLEKYLSSCDMKSVSRTETTTIFRCFVKRKC